MCSSAEVWVFFKGETHGRQDIALALWLPYGRYLCICLTPQATGRGLDSRGALEADGASAAYTYRVFIFF